MEAVSPVLVKTLGVRETPNALFQADLGRITQLLLSPAGITVACEYLPLWPPIAARESDDIHTEPFPGCQHVHHLLGHLAHGEYLLRVAYVVDSVPRLGFAQHCSHPGDGIFNMTEGTLLRDQQGNELVADDNFTGFFGQAEYQFSDQLKGVVAARVDRSTLFDTQVSPKAAIVWSPSRNHTIRATFNRAFQYANYSEFFLFVDAAAPVDLAPLELGIEAAVSAVVGVPVDLPLNFGLTRVLALGNDDLEVEEILGWEVGYKGIFERKLFLTVDAYYNRLKDFITDLLPGVNPDFPAYAVPDAVPAAFRPTVEGAIVSNLGANFPLFATLPDGTPAFVISYSNAGRVNEYGGELSINYHITDEILLGANYSYFKFEVKDQKVGDVLLPNAPKNKGNVSISYFGRNGLNFTIRLKAVEEYPWAAGVFRGDIPGYGIVNVAGGYRVHENVHLGVTVTNVLDKEHFELFGGSVNGRRAVGSLAVIF